MFKNDGKVKFVKKQKNLSKNAWKILIVDDEEGVHTITKTVLGGFSFENADLHFISAYSALEAQKIMMDVDDISLILLDVVMEEDDSGLKFVHFVREELKNDMVRIVLRTGQPGQAPERDVIIKYDINDYKEKTELTSDKLFTTIIASVRNYRDLKAIEEKKNIIEQNRIGLKNIINASANLFEIHSLKEFANGVLMQLISLLKLNNNSMYVKSDGFTASKDASTHECVFLAGTGKYSEQNRMYTNCNEFDEKILQQLEKAELNKESYFEDDVFVGYYETHNGKKNFLYMNGCESLSDDDKRLIHIFSSNVSIAFDNIYLDKEVAETQAEIIYTLGEVMENRSKETASHVKRVAQYTYLLAEKYGLDEEEAFTLKSASPLHDIGKIGIEDSILLKPGKLTDEEFVIMKTHAQIGYDILKKSTRSILRAAAIVAHEHHEKYDGSGYPTGKRDTDIHVYGRIVAIADVFDALTHKRVYKQAWTFDDAVAYLIEQKGKHFDPQLIDLFLSDLDAVKKIYAIK
jgi:response regulator RpfG family c-di-GMP phosphodiesterase